MTNGRWLRLHSYCGSVDMVQAFAKLNCYFSFSASIIHIPKHAAALRAVPEDRLLLETDAPDQLPRSLRGGVSPQGEEVHADEDGLLNEPCWLPLVLEAAAAHRQVSESHLAELTSFNALRVFRFREHATPDATQSKKKKNGLAVAWAVYGFVVVRRQIRGTSTEVLDGSSEMFKSEFPQNRRPTVEPC